jgi:hypothetical protein
MSILEKQLNKFEPTPDLKIQVMAVLDDIGGKRYFVKTEAGKYLYLAQGLEHCEEVDESAVASAIIKHGYKPVADGQVFEFGQRMEVLK